MFYMYQETLTFLFINLLRKSNKPLQTSFHQWGKSTDNFLYWMLFCVGVLEAVSDHGAADKKVVWCIFSTGTNFIGFTLQLLSSSVKFIILLARRFLKTKIWHHVGFYFGKFKCFVTCWVLPFHLACTVC